MKQLSAKTKFGFAIGDLGGNLFFTMMGTFLLAYLTDDLGLSITFAPTAIFVGKIWDAITDPLVGFLSDRTKTKWGRRRPYMFAGAILLFVSMILMFTIQPIENQTVLFIVVMLLYCLLNTAYTLVNIPYAALQPELTNDYNERTNLTGWRMAFAIVGTLVGILGVSAIKDSFAGDNMWLINSAVMGGIMLLTTMVTVFTVKEPKKFEVAHIPSKPSAFIEALKNPVFLTALIPWALFITGVTVVQTSFVYYAKYIWNDEGLVALALGVLILAALIATPLWAFIAKKLSRKTCYILGMSWFSLGLVSWFFLGEMLGPFGSLIVLGVAGIGFSTHYIMPHSIIPDIVEYDYVQTGSRREGIYYSIWNFLMKVGQASAFPLVGLVFSMVGYDPKNGAPVTAEGLASIKWLCSIVPVIIILAGIVVLSFYPITQKFYDENILKKEDEVTESA